MYALPESLTLRNVNSVQQELLRILRGELEKGEGEARKVVFDFSHLKDLDLAGLQLLLAAAVSLGKNNISLKMINIQEPIQELLQLTGALDILTFEAF